MFKIVKGGRNMKDEEYLMFIEILLKLVPRCEKEKLYYILLGSKESNKS